MVHWDTIQELREGGDVVAYKDLLAAYLKELADGTISRKPCSQKYIDDVDYCMGRYWQHLGEKPGLQHLSAEGFRKVIADIGIDNENRRDFFGTKDHIFKALTGFMRLLVRDGHKLPSDMDAIKKLKPKPKWVDDVDDYPDETEVRDIIKFNLNRRKGRREFDIYAMNTLLHLYAYTGIRKMEAAALVIEDIGQMVLEVDGQRCTADSLKIWGKGGKRRRVPIPKALGEALDIWIMNHRPRDTDSNLLLVQQDGSPMTESSINQRFARISKVFGRKVMPHGLRHACATINAMDGMPAALIQVLLGHSNIKITDRYLNPTEMDLFKYMQKKPMQVKVVGETPVIETLPPNVIPMF